MMPFVQTGAMLVDAYRELNAKKLFWVTLALSAVVVGAFGAVGFDEHGFSIFGKSFQSPIFNTTMLPKAQLYKDFFVSLGVQTWLSYFAIILALVSTAPIFPDFLSGGAVDLYLARPISRTRLFLTKYAVGVLFVAVQVAAFCVASFLVIGVRGGVWVPGIFLAVPVVVLMFSYLWCVCALLGVLTRSTITSLVVTLVVWFLIFGVHATETTLLRFSIGSRVEVRQLDETIDFAQHEIDQLQARQTATAPATQSLGVKMTAMQRQIDSWQITLEQSKQKRAAANDDPFVIWHSIAYAVKWPLPKTSETTALLERWLDRTFRGPRDREGGRDGAPDADDEEANRNFFANQRVRQATALELHKELQSRSVTWVIGTSLLFEAAVLGLSAWIFSRRDY